MIKIACSGFPVGRKRYESRLKTVELNRLFDSFPLVRTLEKWREAALSGFEYIVCASKIITHPAKNNLKTPAFSRRAHHIGYFQDSAEVRHAFQRTWHAAETLNAKIVLFQCAPTLTPHADHVGRIQAFFRPIDRGTRHFVWEPPLSWPRNFVESLGKTMHMTAAANPLSKKYKPSNEPMRYFRLGAEGRTSGVTTFSDSELRDVKSACDKPLSYVVFNNGPTAFMDAVRFSEMTRV